MPMKFTPSPRQAETLNGLLETLREYDDNQLADCVASIVDAPQDIGLMSRAIAIAGAERIRNKQRQAAEITTPSKKAQVAAEFGIDEHGLITSPGRYEKEPWYIVPLDELEEADQFGDADENSYYYSLHILVPGKPEVDQIIAETGKRGFIMSMTSTGLRVIESDFDTEADTRQAFSAMQHEHK